MRALIITSLMLLQCLEPGVWCQIGRSYEQDHPNHVLGSLGLRGERDDSRPTAETSLVATPQTGNTFS